MHRGRPFGLDADDLDFGALSADPRRDASKQSTATDGNEDCRRVFRHLFKQLNADRALARDRHRIIVGVNVGAPSRARSFLRQCVCLVEGAINDDLLHPITTDRSNTIALLTRSIRRQINRAVNLQVSARIGDALRMVTCRGADDATFAFSCR